MSIWVVCHKVFINHNIILTNYYSQNLFENNTKHIIFIKWYLLFFFKQHYQSKYIPKLKSIAKLIPQL